MRRGTVGLREAEALRRQLAQARSQGRMLGQRRIRPLMIGHKDEDIRLRHASPATVHNSFMLFAVSAAASFGFSIALMRALNGSGVTGPS